MDPARTTRACFAVALAVCLGCEDASHESRPPRAPPPASDSAARAAMEDGGAPAYPVSDPRLLQPGAPSQQIQTIYERGNVDSAQLFDLSVDDATVYWCQISGRLYAGSKDGSATPEQIGQWHRQLGAYGIAYDAEHVYWLDKQELYRWPKTGGEPERITLDGEANGFTVGQRYVYVAAWGCPRITRIDKRTLEREHLEIVLSRPGSGPTTLVEDGDELFCGAWSSVYVVRDWTAPAVRLTDSATRVWGLAVIGEHVYWLDRGSIPAQPIIARVPRAGGDSERFEISEQLLGNGATQLVREPNAERLWYSDGKFLVSFDLATQRYAVRASETPIRIALDGGHVYWTSAFHTYGVRRMRLDAPVLYHPN